MENRVPEGEHFERTRQRNLAEIALMKIHATFKEGKFSKVGGHSSSSPRLRKAYNFAMQMKRKWLREFLYQSETREDFHRRLVEEAEEMASLSEQSDSPSGREELVRKPVKMPEYYELRQKNYSVQTGKQSSEMIRAADLDGFLMQQNIESRLTRQRMQDEGLMRAEMINRPTLSRGHEFLMSAFEHEVEAATMIQRAFRRFKAACEKVGWPSASRQKKVDVSKVKSRYLEIRHEMVTEENLQKWTKLKDTHGLLANFEEAARARSLRGELRTPKSGKSEKYRLQEPMYRREMLGEEFVKLENMLKAAGAPAAEATAASIAAVAKAAMKMKPNYQDKEEGEEKEKEDAAMDLRNEKDPMKRAQMAAKSMLWYTLAMGSRGKTPTKTDNLSIPLSSPSRRRSSAGGDNSLLEGSSVMMKKMIYGGEIDARIEGDAEQRAAAIQEQVAKMVEKMVNDRKMKHVAALQEALAKESSLGVLGVDSSSSLYKEKSAVSGKSKRRVTLTGLSSELSGLSDEDSLKLAKSESTKSRRRVSVSAFDDDAGASPASQSQQSLARGKTSNSPLSSEQQAVGQDPPSGKGTAKKPSRLGIAVDTSRTAADDKPSPLTEIVGLYSQASAFYSSSSEGDDRSDGWSDDSEDETERKPRPVPFSSTKNMSREVTRNTSIRSFVNPPLAWYPGGMSNERSKPKDILLSFSRRELSSLSSRNMRQDGSFSRRIGSTSLNVRHGDSFTLAQRIGSSSMNVRQKEVDRAVEAEADQPYSFQSFVHSANEKFRLDRISQNIFPEDDPGQRLEDMTDREPAQADESWLLPQAESSGACSSHKDAPDSEDPPNTDLRHPDSPASNMTDPHEQSEHKAIYTWHAQPPKPQQLKPTHRRGFLQGYKSAEGPISSQLNDQLMSNAIVVSPARHRLSSVGQPMKPVNSSEANEPPSFVLSSSILPENKVTSLAKFPRGYSMDGSSGARSPIVQDANSWLPSTKLLVEVPDFNPSPLSPKAFMNQVDMKKARSLGGAWNTVATVHENLPSPPPSPSPHDPSAKRHHLREARPSEGTGFSIPPSPSTFVATLRVNPNLIVGNLRDEAILPRTRAMSEGGGNLVGGPPSRDKASPAPLANRTSILSSSFLPTIRPNASPTQRPQGVAHLAFSVHQKH